MNAAIKKCLNENDMRRLHYIFLDSLDIDPTFDTYKDDYNECAHHEGFFEINKELTPFSYNSDQWDKEYWLKLKNDLRKNFSRERFEHMRKVAQVYYKEKIMQLQEERANKIKETDKVSVTQTKREVDINNNQRGHIEEVSDNRNLKDIQTETPETPAKHEHSGEINNINTDSAKIGEDASDIPDRRQEREPRKPECRENTKKGYERDPQFPKRRRPMAAMLIILVIVIVIIVIMIHRA